MEHRLDSRRLELGMVRPTYRQLHQCLFLRRIVVCHSAQKWVLAIKSATYDGPSYSLPPPHHSRWNGGLCAVNAGTRTERRSTYHGIAAPERPDVRARACSRNPAAGAAGFFIGGNKIAGTFFI